MARPKAELPLADALRALIDEEGRLALRVTRCAKFEALEIAEGRVFMKVRAKPEDGKANDAVRDLLASALELAPSRLELLRGATSREKQFRISL